MYKWRQMLLKCWMYMTICILFVCWMLIIWESKHLNPKIDRLKWCRLARKYVLSVFYYSCRCSGWCSSVTLTQTFTDCRVMRVVMWHVVRLCQMMFSEDFWVSVFHRGWSCKCRCSAVALISVQSGFHWFEFHVFNLSLCAAFSKTRSALYSPSPSLCLSLQSCGIMGSVSQGADGCLGMRDTVRCRRK